MVSDLERRAASAQEPERPAHSPVPGAAIALAVAAVATLVGRALPVLGGPVAAVIIGVAVAATIRPVTRWPGCERGFGLVGGVALQVAVVLLGAQISIRQALTVGWESLPVMLSTLTVCFIGAWLLGRWLAVPSDLRTLVGTGTAICGASAIAAITPVLRPKSSTVAYAMSTVFLFNIAAVLLFPPLGHALGLSQHAFGVFAGTAVNDTSSVVAAATTYGAEATQTAVVVKLTRALMIIPVALVLAVVVARREGSAEGHRPSLTKLVPWFLVGFVAVAVANSLWPFPAEARTVLGDLSTFLITWALAAIGLSTNVSALRSTGLRPVLFGGLLWVAVSVTSLGVQAVTSGF